MVWTSQPGSLYSGDDFYVTDTGLTVIETTIENYNRSLWAEVKPESVFTWLRANVANRLATNGSEWTELELRHQSGTCNNQWIVVDYKRFVPGRRLGDGTLWVSEAMPGHSHRADVTHVLLEQGSWPSYNIPYFEDIWRVGGWGEEQLKQPALADQYSFTKDPRALMFARAREENALIPFESYMDLMRYNRRDDRLAQNDACNGISARCDLNPHNGTGAPYECFGGIDCKISRWRPSTDDLSFVAVSSPTFGGGEPPFSWSAQNASVDGCMPSQHVGQPDTFDFGWYALPSSVDHVAKNEFEDITTRIPQPGNHLSLLAAIVGVDRDNCYVVIALLSSILAIAIAGKARYRRGMDPEDLYIRLEANAA